MRRQRGLTLLESLIALVVAALGIFGILGVQMRTLTDTQTSLRRAQAIRLIEDLSERLNANPGALAVLTNYQTGWNTSPVSGTDCHAVSCTSDQLATFDLADWKTAVKRVLPMADANVFLAPGDVGTDPRMLGVMISWRENESYTDAAYVTDIDATEVRAYDGSLSKGAGAAVTCPANRTCHLQYISGTNRCVPDRSFMSDPNAAPSPGDPPPQFYCSSD